jgi:hypothetical protein
VEPAAESFADVVGAGLVENDRLFGESVAAADAQRVYGVARSSGLARQACEEASLDGVVGGEQSRNGRQFDLEDAGDPLGQLDEPIRGLRQEGIFFARHRAKAALFDEQGVDALPAVATLTELNVFGRVAAGLAHRKVVARLILVQHESLWQACR